MSDPTACPRSLAEALAEPTTENKAWTAFVAAARGWARYLDQWDKIRFRTDCGTIYVTISREDRYPDTFEDLDR